MVWLLFFEESMADPFVLWMGLKSGITINCTFGTENVRNIEWCWSWKQTLSFINDLSQSEYRVKYLQANCDTSFFFFFFKKIWLVQMNLWQWLIHSIIIKGCSLNNSAKTNCSLRSFFITSISWLFYQWVYWPLNMVFAFMTVCHAHCS